MASIRIYNPTEIGHIRLRTFATACNATYAAHDMDERIKVEDIYYDYGQNWKYTALVTYDDAKGDSWQTFCPRDYEIILECDNIATLLRYADYYVEARLNGEICVDISKIK